MPEEIYKQFEKKKAEVLKQPEFKESPEKNKEILRQVVSERIAQTQPSRVSQQTDDQDTKKISIEPKERQIKLLTDLAFEKGISRAIEVVKRMENPYLLDEFHDALVDELYNKLIETGKLKQL